MRKSTGVNRYTGSVFLTKYLSDSAGHSRRVECESFESMARRMGVHVDTVYRLAKRGAIDGAFLDRGFGWAPSPVRLLGPGEAPRWIGGPGELGVLHSHSAGSGSSALGSVQPGAPENHASVVKGGAR